MPVRPTITDYAHRVLEAVRQGDATLLRQHLGSGLVLEALDEEGVSALLLAVRGGHV